MAASLLFNYFQELKPRNIYINLYSDMEEEDDIVNNMSLAKLWNSYPHILDVISNFPAHSKF